jgi:hypothetical protein
MIEIPPSVDFCISRGRIDWKDVVWAVEKGVFGWRDVQAFAVANLNDELSTTFELDLQIASLTKNEASQILTLAQEAAELITSDLSFVPERWRVLLLTWVYERRELFKSPLTVVEELYAEFGYPRDMESFIAFLPPSDGWDPSIHTTAENERRLMLKWHAFLRARGQVSNL